MYFIFGLPRSRTTWLAAFLSNDSTPCYHEKSIEFPNIEELGIFMKEGSCGLSDTALVLYWKQLKALLPEAKMVVIDRPYKDSLEDLVSIGLSGETKMLQAIHTTIEEIKLEASIPVVRFSSLNKKDVIKRLCAYLGLPFNEKKFIEFSEMMIQPNKELLLERVSRNIENFKSLYGEWL